MKDNLQDWMARNSIYGQPANELLAILDPMYGVTLEDGPDNSEAAVQARCRVIAPMRGGALWRNNNGANEILEADGSARFIRFGLGNNSAKLNKRWKSSDLIGITQRRASYVGEMFGVFTAIEVKSPGWKGVKTERETAQAAFQTTVKSKGGIARFVQSATDYESLFL